MTNIGGWHLARVAFLFFLGIPAATAMDLPGYFGTVSLPAQSQSWTPEVYADFGLFLAKSGEKTGLDPASVRVATATGQLLATAFEADRDVPDRGLVRWSAPALPMAAGKAEFRIYFAPKAARKWEPFGADKVGEANLLPNGGFETTDAGGKAADFWGLGRNAELVGDREAAHSGQNCIKLSPNLYDPKEKLWINNLRTPGTPGVAVEPGKSYRFSFWARTENASGGSFNSANQAHIYWYGANGGYISHEGGPAGRRGTSEWTEYAITLTAPAGAHFAKMFCYFFCAEGALYLDDVSINPLQKTLLATPGAESPLVKRFDFAKDDSSTWPGFAAVTPDSAYARERGFGWLGTARPEAESRALPDDLARTYVLPRAPSMFVVDLPDGNYRAWFLIGDNGLGQNILPTFVNWTVKAGAQEILSYRPDARTWYETVVYRNLNDWWAPGVDVYERFISPQFREYLVSFAVQGGQAKFELHGMPLCAMILYPADADAEVSAELGQLRAARRRSVPIHLVQPANQRPVGLADADRQRGYAVFVRDLARPVLPNSAPQQGELTTRIESFAALGEYVAMSFAVYPMRDLGPVHVAVSDLVGPEGSRIASTSIEVGVVRYVERVPSNKDYNYSIGPGPIQVRNPMPVPKDMAMRWWLRVRTPAGAVPGNYSGKIHIAPENAPASDLDVVLRLIPVKLDSTPISAGMYHVNDVYWYIYWWRKAFDDRDGWLREQTFQHEMDDFALLKEYGLNSLMFCDDNRAGMRFNEKGEGTFAPDGPFVRWMDLYAKAGMGPMGWYGFYGIGYNFLDLGVFGPKLRQFSPEWEHAYRSIIAWVKDMEKKRGWPEVIFYLSDEMSNHGAKGAESGRRLVGITKDIPGIRTIASMNGPWERVMLPGLKIAMPNHAFPITGETIAEIRKAGDDLWIYNVGNSRIMWGLYLWRIGAHGRSQWAHRTHETTEPWNAFDGDSMYNVTWSTPGKPLPTPVLWETNEGLTDLRYVTALEKAIAVARASRNAVALKAAEAAQKELDELRTLIPVDARLIIGDMDASEAGKDAVDRFSDSRYLDRLRWMMASHIITIQSAMGR